jgi:hypothetical protein
MLGKCLNCSEEFEFSPYQKRGVYCCIKCDLEHREKEKIKLREQRYQDWLKGKDIGVKNPRKLIREFLIRRDGYRCKCCGIDKWNGKDITLWTDHIDGNATNNHPSNFQLVCPNCDSQSDTFGAKNYGKGRKSLGLPQYG